MSLTADTPPAKSPRRSTRDRPAKAPLSEEVVVDAALAILQSDGLEAVTMRRVATALDTGAASLYVYVSGRDGLLQAMLDRVIASIDLEAPDSSCWRDQVHSLCQRLREALLAHPGTAAMTLADPPTTEAVLGLTENLLGILLSSGIEQQVAAWACDVVISLVTAVASEEDVRQRQADDEDSHRHADELYKTFTQLPPDRFPLLSANGAWMVAGNSDRRFRFAIDILIDGILAHQLGD